MTRKKVCNTNTKTYPFINNLIKRWKKRIKKAGLTQEELAKLAGITPTQLSRIIRNKVKKPRMDTIDKVEAVLESRGV